LPTCIAVLGQRDNIYRGQPAQEQNVQERTSYQEYDYGDGGEEAPGNPYGESNGGRIRNNRPVEKVSPSVNSYYQTDCKTKERTLPHEGYCDHYYQLNGCSGSDDQAILRSCPNGLVYTGTGRHGLIGLCDYPHRTDCNGRERHSKCHFLQLQWP
jgi:hypothetical protein